MTNRLFNTIIALAIYVAGMFILPLAIVRLVKDPDDYWSWVGLVVWIWLLLSTLVTTFVTDPIVKAVKEEK
jgi:hypothetical protein